MDQSTQKPAQASNGADRLLETAAAAGIEICFANPGTTEMPLVAAFDRTTGVRPVLCLFEGVCTGAADGYGRMKGRPAMTLLHLGPGFANGIANLHNARRAGSPVVNIIGEHATWHRDCGAPLAMDIAGLARPVSDWVRTSRDGRTLGQDLAEAAAEAGGLPGRVATLIAAHDHMLEPAASPAALPGTRPKPRVSSAAIGKIAEFLRNHPPAALVLGDTASEERGLAAAGRIAAATSAALIVETFSRRLERGAGLPRVRRVPYFPEPALEAMGRFAAVVLAGAADPVSFFGYPGMPSRMVPAGIPVETLAARGEDAVRALEDLADALGAGPWHGESNPAERPGAPSGPLTPETLSAAVAFAQPEGAIVLDEGITSVNAYFGLSAGAPRHSFLNVTGGSIGWGPPCATGAALACPDRPVVVLQADGSALYTFQALWTQAREGLNVTTVLCSNRRYGILGVELKRAGIPVGPQAAALMDLSRPPVDWVGLARSMGVEADRVERAEDLARAVADSVREPGPKLIEAAL